VTEPRTPMLSTFNFRVLITPPKQVGAEELTRTAAFAEVSGLEMTLQTREVREGGYNAGTRRLVERASPGTLVLKRGMTSDAGFWKWVQRCLHGPYPLPYLSGEVHMLAAHRDSMEPVIWKWESGIATKVSAPGLQASGDGGVPIEELHIAHEQLRREV
jgi:phage tail-like protein